jgi:hypothetical protein
MSEETASRRRRHALLRNYATDENLRRRQSLFNYARPPATPQPVLSDLF